MYDSRSDHPRGGTHWPRAWREYGKGDYIDWGTPRQRRLATPEAERVAIAEGLDELADEPVDLPGLKRLGPLAWANRWARHDMDSWDDLDEPERMAAWEIELLGGPEGTVWMEAFGITPESEAEPEPDLDPTDAAAWLTTPPREFFAAMGDAWVIEGPSTTRPEPTREGHYVRVCDMAREVGIDSKHMVEHLRLSGEYVRNHLSWVALPVAQRVYDEERATGALVARYGRRKATEADHYDDLRRLRRLLSEPTPWSRPAKSIRSNNPIRPSAPRPGNPFKARSL